MAIYQKVIKKLKSGTWYPFYNSFYEKCLVDQRKILLESRGGTALESNIFALLKELNSERYKGLKLILSVKKQHRFEVEEKLKRYHLHVEKIVDTGSVSYYYQLATAGYLVNDTSFPGRFVKKEGQIYLNVWHGTPLKKMGRDNEEERVTMGNVMRNLLMADYLLFPNIYMEEKMSQAYMLPNLYRGKLLREGYPRNSIFFDEERGKETKRQLGYEGKQLSIYMPTFRGRADAVDTKDSLQVIQKNLEELDALLREKQALLVKLHPFVCAHLKIDGYRHIYPFPQNYDTYEVLNACDVLITDYSSVLYDFANTGRKIILFVYDRQEYSGTRGMYEDVETYPFAKVQTVQELSEELMTPGGEADDAFLERYDTYECAKAAEKICRQVFLGGNLCQTSEMRGNGRANVMIYAGDLDQNGITTAFCSMMERLDLEKYNYFVSFRMNSLREYPERLKRIPENVGIVPIASEMNLDVITAVAQAVYLKTGKTFQGIGHRLKTAYDREWNKHFGAVCFDHVIHYNGYENYMISLLKEAPCKKTIWVHNDMVREVETKKNPSKALLHDAYRTFDHVAIVSEDIRKSTECISKRKDNIVLIQNCQDYQQVLRRSERILSFEENTLSTVTLDELKKILEGPGTKIINIGRYSKEKGHERLIRAFDRFWKEHKDAYLVIVGGTGNLYEQTCSLAKSMASGENIVLIRTMGNPMPLLKACDFFVMSSFYEGLGIVLMEANILGLAVAACDVPGPSGFLKKYGGTLLENSEDGLLKGMELFEQGKITPMHVDYEKINRDSINAVEKLL